MKIRKLPLYFEQPQRKKQTSKSHGKKGSRKRNHFVLREFKKYENCLTSDIESVSKHAVALPLCLEPPFLQSAFTASKTLTPSETPFHTPFGSAGGSFPFRQLFWSLPSNAAPF
jgi:hypothetical protein